MSNGKIWSESDSATLRRMASAGYSDGEIAAHMGRGRKVVNRKRLALCIERGMSVAMVAVMARVNMRRRLTFQSTSP